MNNSKKRKNMKLKTDLYFLKSKNKNHLIWKEINFWQKSINLFVIIINLEIIKVCRNFTQKN
jgi:hypothetical protein